MTPDDDILDEVRNRAREIEVLSREAPRKAPAPEQMDLGGGSLVLQHVETVNIYVTIAAPGGTDEGPPQVTVEGR